eukprot:2574114-Amphidinium_carterae.1
MGKLPSTEPASSEDAASSAAHSLATSLREYALALETASSPGSKRRPTHRKHPAEQTKGNGKIQSQHR